MNCLKKKAEMGGVEGGRYLQNRGKIEKKKKKKKKKREKKKGKEKNVEKMKLSFLDLVTNKKRK